MGPAGSFTMLHTWTGNRPLRSTHKPHNSTSSGLQLFSHSLSLWIQVFLFFSPSSSLKKKKAHAAIDSAAREPGTITLFSPRNTTNFLRGVFPPLKALLSVQKTQTSPRARPRLFYKSSAEEDSRRTDVFQAKLKRRDLFSQK